MDKNKAGSNLQTYQSLEQLIKDAYGLNPEQMRKRMEWAEQEAKSDAPLGGIPIPEAPENEFRTILAKMAARGITPKVMADFDEEKQKAFQDGSFLESEILPHEERGESFERGGKAKVTALFDSVKESLRKPLRMAGAVAACLVVGVGIIMAPRIDAVAKKKYRYESLIRDGNTGGIVWNNQDKYMSEISNLEESYKKIKEELEISVLRLNYIPAGMRLSKLTIEDGHARLEFVYNNNLMYMLEVSYPVDNSESRFSDCKPYTFIFNEQLGKEIPIRRNKNSRSEMEYNAYFEFEDAYYYIQGVTKEADFLNIIQNLTLE